MAFFNLAFDVMIRNEGGFVNHTVAGDRGGQTYAGIARTFHNNWKGWDLIDAGDTSSPDLKLLVSDFYRDKFWNKIKGDDIKSQRVAETIFDFAVNAGYRTASKLVQLSVGTKPDGFIGPETLEKLNEVDEELFVSKYALAKMARYAEIVKRDRSQTKFLLGWLNRTLAGVS